MPVERAEKTPPLSIVAKPLLSMSWPTLRVSKIAHPRIRVRTRDGRQLEFNVSLVDLGLSEMIGSRGYHSPIRLALGDIESVWLRRPRPCSLHRVVARYDRRDCIGGSDPLPWWRNLGLGRHRVPPRWTPSLATPELEVHALLGASL